MRLYIYIVFVPHLKWLWGPPGREFIWYQGGLFSIETRLWARWSGFSSRHGQWWDFFLFATAPRL